MYCMCAGVGSEAGRRRSSSVSRGSFLQSIASAKAKLLDSLKDARVVPSLVSKEVKVTFANLTTYYMFAPGNTAGVGVCNSGMVTRSVPAALQVRVCRSSEATPAQSGREKLLRRL